MGLSIISNNTTIKKTALPYGAYTFPTNGSTDILTVATGAVYKITAIIFSALTGTTIIPYVKNPTPTTYNLCTDIKAAVTAPGSFNSPNGANVNAQVKVMPATANSNILIFDPPLILSEGYKLGFSVTGAGGAVTYAMLGEAEINTP